MLYPNSDIEQQAEVRGEVQKPTAMQHINMDAIIAGTAMPVNTHTLEFNTHRNSA
jgi:hypothetical protein